jgi:hypothetical protein
VRLRITGPLEIPSSLSSSSNVNPRATSAQGAHGNMDEAAIEVWGKGRGKRLPACPPRAFRAWPATDFALCWLRAGSGRSWTLPGGAVHGAADTQACLLGVVPRPAAYAHLRSVAALPSKARVTIATMSWRPCNTRARDCVWIQYTLRRRTLSS